MNEGMCDDDDDDDGDGSNDDTHWAAEISQRERL